MPSIARRRDALYSAPFFKAAAEHAAGSSLVDLIAEEAELRTLKSGAPLPPDVAFGTFIVVVEGELKHTEARGRTKRCAVRAQARAGRASSVDDEREP